MKEAIKIVVFLTIFWPKLGLAEKVCSSYDPSNDDSAISKSRNIVFFASWCLSCLDSIRSSDPKKDIYVAVFDSKRKAQQALSFALADKIVGSHCIVDQDNILARKYNVSSLPLTIKKPK